MEGARICMDLNTLQVLLLVALLGNGPAPTVEHLAPQRLDMENIGKGHCALHMHHQIGDRTCRLSTQDTMLCECKVTWVK